MYILGINAAFHDTSACLLKDGKIVAAIEEERLSRKKHCQDFPMRSIKYCLNKAGISLEEVNYVVQDLYETENDFPDQWMKLPKEKRIKVRHHLGHAAAAYYCSGFTDAAILTTDGGGSKGIYSEMFHSSLVRERQVFWVARGKDIIELSTFGSPEYGKEKPMPMSIGHIYEEVCDILGYGPLEGPGKVMGLSSYGTGRLSRDFLENYVQYPNGHIFYKRERLEYEEYRRKCNEKVKENHAELSYLIQKETEECMIRMAEYLYKVTGSKNLCLGGGVALNCVANRRILNETPFENIYIFPASADAGIAVGNAYYVYYNLADGEFIPQKLESPYLGRAYTDLEIEAAICEHNSYLEVKKSNKKELLFEIANAIADGRIVGWFQGGSEIGPRSLGHRSILANPCIPEMKDILNERVKHREVFRPFAPSVLKERASEFFNIATESPYMLLVADVLDGKKELLPSVTHVDGTARLQTVTKGQNDIFYELIKTFGNLTGVPVLLNTSFNVAGEPIVEKPIDAVRCFVKTDIDILVIENYIIKKRMFDD